MRDGGRGRRCGRGAGRHVVGRRMGETWQEARNDSEREGAGFGGLDLCQLPRQQFLLRRVLLYAPASAVHEPGGQQRLLCCQVLGWR